MSELVICKKCGVPKPEDQYYRGMFKNGKKCGKCTREYQNERHLMNKEIIRTKNKTDFSTVQQMEDHLIAAAKKYKMTYNQIEFQVSKMTTETMDLLGIQLR